VFIYPSKWTTKTTASSTASAVFPLFVNSLHKKYNYSYCLVEYCCHSSETREEPCCYSSSYDFLQITFLLFFPIKKRQYCSSEQVMI
jgi:hypothetical protein